MIKLYRDEIWLRDKYENFKWSQSEIASYCNASQATIYQWMKRHNIKSRSLSESNKGICNGSWVSSSYKEYPTLHREYVVNKKSIRDIASEAGVSIRSIARWLSDNNIKTRTGSESLVNIKTGKEHPCYKGATLCPVCGGNKTSSSKKCRKCHFDYLKEHPKDNGSYLGVYDISQILRSNTQEWRLSVFKRDNYTCMGCDDDRGGNLHAHHIIPFSDIRDQLIIEYGSVVEYDFDTDDNRIEFIKHCRLDARLHDVDNGITLCKECHLAEHRSMKFDKDESIYMYYGIVVDNYDDGIITLDLDLGFGLTRRVTMRLFGVDIKGSGGKGKIDIIYSKKLMSLICAQGQQVVIRTYKTGKYGEWSGILMIDHMNISELLAENGFEKRESYDSDLSRGV